jgi:predicted nucleic acid-binding Zn ribbon protein
MFGRKKTPTIKLMPVYRWKCQEPKCKFEPTTEEDDALDHCKKETHILTLTKFMEPIKVDG